MMSRRILLCTQHKRARGIRNSDQCVRPAGGGGIYIRYVHCTVDFLSRTAEQAYQEREDYDYYWWYNRHARQYLIINFFFIFPSGLCCLVFIEPFVHSIHHYFSFAIHSIDAVEMCEWVLFCCE